MKRLTVFIDFHREIKNRQRVAIKFNGENRDRGVIQREDIVFPCKVQQMMSLNQLFLNSCYSSLYYN